MLILGLIIFLGAHSVRLLADDWRTTQIEKLGEAKWKGLYTVASLVGFGLIVWGYGMARAEPVVIWSPPIWARHLVGLFVLVTFVLLVAAYLPGTRIKAAVGHPMVLSVKVWALSHLLAKGTLAAMILFGSFLAWAVADFVSLRRRDRATGKTYPSLGWQRDAQAVAIGLVAWLLFARYGHEWLIGVRPIG